MRAGATFALREGDCRHVAVLRLAPGAKIEVVDASGAVFEAVLEADRRHARAVEKLGDAEVLPAQVVVLAGVLTGQRWDALVDGVVQAGASVIVPVVEHESEREAQHKRAERGRRVVEAAAKQSKRGSAPQLFDPVDIQDVIALPTLASQALEQNHHYLLLEPGAPATLVATLEHLLHRTDSRERPVVNILVGPARGFDAQVVAQLAESSWTPVTLGPPVLRSELAAAVAVACAIQVTS